MNFGSHACYEAYVTVSCGCCLLPQDQHLTSAASVWRTARHQLQLSAKCGNVRGKRLDGLPPRRLGDGRHPGPIVGQSPDHLALCRPGLRGVGPCMPGSAVFGDRDRPGSLAHATDVQPPVKVVNLMSHQPGHGVVEREDVMPTVGAGTSDLDMPAPWSAATK